MDKWIALKSEEKAEYKGQQMALDEGMLRKKYISYPRYKEDLLPLEDENLSMAEKARIMIYPVFFFIKRPFTYIEKFFYLILYI
ncbi:hypothetical protein ACFLTD_02140, partial [Elusimicrobiota bacterium]